jgi:tRNA-2-methylthio-N6-dimethylallyladenosine synthase
MDGQIPRSVADIRLKKFQTLLQQNQLEFNNSCRGKNLEVLVERQVSPNVWFGKSEYLQNVTFSSDKNLHAQLVSVRITSKENLMNLEGTEV